MSTPIPEGPASQTSAARRYKRVRIKLPLYISLKESVFKKMVRLETRDVSGGGLAFECSHRIPLEANSRVVVSKLGGLRDGARIEGKVAYRRKNPGSRRYLVGVAFEKFVNVTREELLDCLEAWEATDPGSPRPT